VTAGEKILWMKKRLEQNITGSHNATRRHQGSVARGRDGSARLLWRTRGLASFPGRTCSGGWTTGCDNRVSIGLVLALIYADPHSIRTRVQTETHVPQETFSMAESSAFTAEIVPSAVVCDAA